MIITTEEFNQIREVLYQRFGISLSDKKRSLVTGRLGKLMNQKKFTSFSQFISYVKKDSTGVALQELVNKMSTNHTFFYREPAHFEFMESVALPEIITQLKQNSSKDIRIWCAAASTGEEPYTIMMTLMQTLKTDYSSWQAGLLATDISTNVIEKAKKGIYSKDSVMLIPQHLRKKYLKPVDSESFQFIPRVRNEITFRLFNLMNPVLPFKKPFHIIFCRNVMIYFDQKTRCELVERFYNCLEPNGYLFTGHSESIRQCNSSFKMLQPAVYRKV